MRDSESDMTSIWEATCKCGDKTRVELRGQAGDRVLRVGCADCVHEVSEKVDVCHKRKKPINISRDALEVCLARGDTVVTWSER